MFIYFLQACSYLLSPLCMNLAPFPQPRSECLRSYGEPLSMGVDGASDQANIKRSRLDVDGRPFSSQALLLAPSGRCN